MDNLPQVIDPPTEILAISENSVSKMRQQILLFKEFVNSQLVQGTDYGNIPGCKMPCLFKPGAEKLLRLFNLGTRVVGRDEKIDLEAGYAQFSYTIEVFSTRNNQAISQCEGSANSKESKYAKIPLHNALNTLQKMAQKRALVGAVLNATAASDFFTQDIEEGLPDVGSHVSHPTPSHAQSGNQDLISEAQGKRLYAITKTAGWSPQEVSDYLYGDFGYDNSREIKWVDYKTICEHIERNPKGEV